LSIPGGQGDKTIELLPEMDGKRKKKKDEEEPAKPVPGPRGPNDVVRPVRQSTK
jgi:hypothetical protein